MKVKSKYLSQQSDWTTYWATVVPFPQGAELLVFVRASRTSLQPFVKLYRFSFVVVKQQKLKAEYSLPSTAEVKYVGCYTLIPNMLSCLYL